MTAEVVGVPVSLPLSRRDERAAMAVVWRHARHYSAIRLSDDEAAITRARTDWGMALLNWVDKAYQLAVAEDHQAAELNASADVNGSRRTAGSVCDAAKPRVSLLIGRERVDDCWKTYQQARAGRDESVINEARDAWRVELSSWIESLVKRKGTEDIASVAAAKAQRAHVPPVNPEDAFPGPPRDRTEVIVRESKERDRRERIRLDRSRYESNTQPGQSFWLDG